MKASGQRSQPLTGRSRQRMTRWRKKIPKKLWHQGCCVECLGAPVWWSVFYDLPTSFVFICWEVFVAGLWPLQHHRVTGHQWLSLVETNLPNSSRESLRVVKAFRKFCLVVRSCPCFLAQDPSWVGCGRAASVLWVGVFDGFCCHTWNQSLRFLQYV